VGTARRLRRVSDAVSLIRRARSSV
jgi:hypothetical protein